MRVNIRGKNENVTRKELRIASKFFASRLMTEQMCGNIKITIENEDDLGPCDGNSVWIDTNDRPREFLIALNPTRGKRKQLITLAHEMVHVKQQAKGELKTLMTRNEDKWQGRYIKEDTSYFEKPWEIEAFGRELGLYQMYLLWKKTWKIKF